MTTVEILASFMKGTEKTTISVKQRAWLLKQAQQEKLLDADLDIIYLAGAQFVIRNCKVMASGGSYVGTRIVQDRYVLEKQYWIRFDAPPNMVTIARDTDIAYYKREGHSFKVLNPRTKLPIT